MYRIASLGAEILPPLSTCLLSHSALPPLLTPVAFPYVFLIIYNMYLFTWFFPVDFKLYEGRDCAFNVLCCTLNTNTLFGPGQFRICHTSCKQLQ